MKTDIDRRNRLNLQTVNKEGDIDAVHDIKARPLHLESPAFQPDHTQSIAAPYLSSSTASPEGRVKQDVISSFPPAMSFGGTSRPVNTTLQSPIAQVWV